MYFLSKMLSLRDGYKLAGFVLPACVLACLGFLLYGTVYGLFFAPADFKQGDGFRIIYVHVPAAFLSLGVYTIIFLSSVWFLIFRIKLADILADCSAAIGAIFTLIALITGALWGKPMWGTYWVWDARLTSELILLFLYMGYMGLRSAIINPQTAAKMSAILAIVGMVDIPLVHFSVEWWSTLHQGATLSKLAKPSIDTTMLMPLLSMITGFFFFYLSIVLFRMRSKILEREYGSEWVQSYLAVNNRKG